ncbi:hypothetical protein TcasGA2_TC032505 [Tribolium castaneum]|uniref:G-protein coupled receptors family 2 profile 1 domain-containing protein n=1 Tax=Tribolium castaneum TaxID=7070 RepID=A0A139WKU1_TRICA|nr:hypothetical protein TcasGA2_TC032505 [Tribolium castaneum]
MAFDYSPRDLEVIALRQLECDEIINKSSNILGRYCPGRFDGWSCWPSTPAGEIANQSCPEILNYDPNPKQQCSNKDERMYVKAS